MAATLAVLLKEFDSILDGNWVCTDEDSFWLLQECRMVLKWCLHQALSQVTSASLQRTTELQSSTFPNDILSLVQQWNDKVQALHTTCRLDPDALKYTPRVLALQKPYGLLSSDVETFIVCITDSNPTSLAMRHVLSQFTRGTDAEREKFAVFAGLTRLDLAAFIGEERAHVKEGLVMIDEPYDPTSDRIVRISLAAGLALRGLPLDKPNRLKLAGTALMTIIDPKAPGKPVLEPMVAQAIQGLGDVSDVTQLLEQLEQVSDDDGEGGDEVPVGSTDANESAAVDQLNQSVSDEDLVPYSDSLSYMDDHFGRITQLIRLSSAQIAKDLGSVEEEVPTWERSRGRYQNLHEFQVKVQMLEAKIATRLELTLKAGLALPRLEQLIAKLGLSSFERDTLILLVGFTLSPVLQKALKKEFGRGLMVSTILKTLSPSFKEQIELRKYFYKGSTMLRRGLVQIVSSRYDELAMEFVLIDRRLLDWLVGLDTEMNELLEGLNLYTPNVPLDSVILPGSLQDDILRQVTSFGEFMKYAKKHGLDEDMTTKGLVMLFHGASGTGKTMMVNALATKLKKRVLLINFAEVQGNKNSSSSEGLFQSLFREADMSNAIVFFDECESFFAQRGAGGSLSLTELLTEIERYQGIVFLATNRAQDLDEAMYRRIHAVHAFTKPSHIQREAIWKVHVQHEAICVAEGIDWHSLALKYDLAGGFIKNAVTSALMLAIARDGAESPIITEGDLIEGCAMQMRGSLQLSSLSQGIVPESGLDTVILTDTQRKLLRKAIQLEKARSVLFNEWGFGDTARDNQSTAVLLWGPSGGGKSLCAKAIGFEVGSPLKILNTAELVRGQEQGRSKSRLSAAFDDAGLANAVVVLDNFNVLLEGDSKSQQDFLFTKQLQYEITKYHGIVVLCVTSPQDLASVVHQIDGTLLSLLKVIVELSMPQADEREQLWDRAIPRKVPGRSDIDFRELAKRFDFTGGRISRVVYQACAEVALGDDNDRRLTTASLMRCGSEEMDKQVGDVYRHMRALFT